LLTFPITFITLGLFALVVNGFTFWLVPKIVQGFTIDTFWWAVLGAIIVSCITSILDRIILGGDGKLGKAE
jgi:putative membrane protein